jgi:hypothetical protein
MINLGIFRVPAQGKEPGYHRKERGDNVHIWFEGEESIDVL